ncbi:hypothetical protein ACWKT5_36830, partial [Streptomyces avermitilis]
PFIFIDVSTSWRKEEVIKSLELANEIHVLIEPDPVLLGRMTMPDPKNPLSKPTPEYELYKYLQELAMKEIKVEFIMNKHSSRAVTKKECATVLYKEPKAFIPILSQEAITKIMWQGSIPYEDEEIKDQLYPIFLNIMRGMVPKHVMPEVMDDESPSSNPLKKLIQLSGKILSRKEKEAE